ncbi:MAG: LruC domain-containing protein, partial [Gammaproteobacteria bacterium]|nr:LruC domain-containing protein [Gammaproteobacteria bacterium]
ELWVTFIKEKASYQNTFGYYIYKTDNPPTTEAEGYALERIVLWPNVSKDNQDPYVTLTSRQTSDITSKNKTIYPNDAPLRAGERTQLLFKDPETGAVSKIFPPGYSVGFWFCADAHDPGWNTNGSYCYALKMDYADNLIFTQSNVRYAPWRYDKSTTGRVVNTYFCSSNPAINDNSLLINKNGYKSYNHYVQYNTTLYGEEFTLYGIEDGGDTSFDDILFAVGRKDYTEVTNSKSEEKLVKEPYRIISTYAYEDNWPTGGDFDLNDVIIEHDQSQTYSVKNIIKSVDDKFTIVVNGAGQYNAFYVQFPEGQEGNVENLKVTVDGVEIPNRWESETNSVIVFPNHQDSWNSGKRTVIVTRDLSGMSYEVGHLDYNPYLIANAISKTGESQIGKGRTEVHIPGKSITTLGKTLEVSGGINTNYFASQFVSEGNEFPFAISLNGVKDWVAPNPGVRVDKTFIKYSSWRNANGFADMNWYFNRKGYDNRYK